VDDNEGGRPVIGTPASDRTKQGGEAQHVEALSLALDDERISILVKGGGAPVCLTMPR